MELMFLILSCLFALLFYYGYNVYKKRQSFWPSRGVPNLQQESFYNQLFKMSFVDTEGALYKQSNEPFGGFIEMYTPMLFARDIDLVKNVYVKDFDHFVNRRDFQSADSFQDMLFSKRDKEWKDLRTKMTPTFTTGKIRKMFPIMMESSKKLVPFLKNVGEKSNGDVDLEDALGRFAMDVISSAAFGIDSQIFKSDDSIVAKMGKKFQLTFGPLLILKILANLAFPFLKKVWPIRIFNAEAEGFFSKILTDSIKHRENTGEKRNDFLQLMIELKHGQVLAERENEEMDLFDRDQQLAMDDKKKTTIEIDDKSVVANCLLFILGGFDTTQSALIFGAYALALNKDIQDKLRKELQDAIENNAGELSFDIVVQNEYLDKVINETLRMYPPALRAERVCNKDYHVPNTNTVLPKDSVFVISIYHFHHDEKYFPNPEVFDPERFSQENKAKRNPYAFMPFGHGPRSCIANRFALAETKSLIANLVLNFEIEPCAKTLIPMTFGNTGSLKPSKGMWLNLKAL